MSGVSQLAMRRGKDDSFYSTSFTCAETKPPIPPSIEEEVPSISYSHFRFEVDLERLLIDEPDIRRMSYGGEIYQLLIDHRIDPSILEHPNILGASFQGKAMGKPYLAIQEKGSSLDRLADRCSLNFLASPRKIAETIDSIQNERSTKVIKSLSFFQTIARDCLAALNHLHTSGYSYGGVDSSQIYYLKSEDRFALAISYRTRPLHPTPGTKEVVIPTEQEFLAMEKQKHFDRWTLGVSLYSIVTGQAAFPEAQQAETTLQESFSQCVGKKIVYPLYFPTSMRRFINALLASPATYGVKEDIHDFLHMPLRAALFEYGEQLQRHPSLSYYQLPDRFLAACERYIEEDTLDLHATSASGPYQEKVTSLKMEKKQYQLHSCAYISYIGGESAQTMERIKSSYRSGKVLEMLPPNIHILHTVASKMYNITSREDLPLDFSSLDAESVELDAPPEQAHYAFTLQESTPKDSVKLLDLVLPSSCTSCIGKPKISPSLSLSFLARDSDLIREGDSYTTSQFLHTIRSLQNLTLDFHKLLLHLQAYNVAVQSIDVDSFVWSEKRGLILTDVKHAVVANTNSGFPEWYKPADREVSTTPHIRDLHSTIRQVGQVIQQLAIGSKDPLTVDLLSHIPKEFFTFIKQATAPSTKQLSLERWLSTPFLASSPQEILKNYKQKQ